MNIDNERPQTHYPFADIAVGTPKQGIQTFTYSTVNFPSVLPGQVVVIPFGPRQTTGIVMSLETVSPVENVRPILEVLGERPALINKQIQLAKWLSDETWCSLYDAASLMLPPDYRRKMNAVYGDNNLLSSESLPEVHTEIITYLKENPKSDFSSIKKFIPAITQKILRNLILKGYIYKEWIWAKPVSKPVYDNVLVLDKPSGSVNLAEKQLALVNYLIQNPYPKLSWANKYFGSYTVKSLREKEIINLRQVRRIRDPLENKVTYKENVVTLNSDQSNAIDKIFPTLNSHTSNIFLLHGPTGSGKTEVYLQSIEKCLELGKKVLFLVPEISQTPQMLSRLENRFPNRIGIFHSGISTGQHYDTWWRTSEGEFDVLLGSRSAIFAPIPDLGLIIIDEEHQWTYKQTDISPHYDARETAKKIADLHGITLIIGSATPDLATYQQALTGKISLLNLPTRIRRGYTGISESIPMPESTIIDMRNELKAGVRSIFSRELESEIQKNIHEGNQTILFLNRRGSAGIVQCRNCGNIARCSSCIRPLTYHSSTSQLICHVCGKKHRNRSECSLCKSKHIRYLGLGTQRVAQEVENTFGIQPLRWDSDITHNQLSHSELLHSFSTGNYPVLIGTQMISQGLHLPNVALVGIILADLGLHLPDFKASERVFQIICQVGGRAGRENIAGKVLIQTYTPDHYAIQYGARQDYLSFFEHELNLRKITNNPPYTRLVKLSYRHTDNNYAEKSANDLKRHIQKVCKNEGISELQIIGPAPAFNSPQRGRYGWQIILRCFYSPINDIVSILKKITIPGNWVIEIDPVNIV